jgi:kinesin family protein C1
MTPPQILSQSSLSGDGKAVMFANVSPRIAHVSESLNTLRFAESVNKVQLGTGKMAPA